MNTYSRGKLKAESLAENFYPKGSPPYRKGTIRKEDFVEALRQAYLLGKKDK